MQSKEILSPSFGVVLADALDAGSEGYKLDPQNYPVFDGLLYHAWLVKADSKEVSQLKAEAFPGSETPVVPQPAPETRPQISVPKRGRPFKKDTL